MIFDQEHVKIHGCFIVWDGITQPDTAQGKTKYSLKVVVPPSNQQDLNDMNNLAQATLQSSPFKGVLPNGAGMPISVADATAFDGLYNGFIVLNCNTQRLPTVYDENGAVMDPMQYGPLIYGGQQVDVLVHCYHYDKAGNKGIATGLDAFSIIVSANAQRQNFGGKGIDTSGAFSGQQPQGQQQQQGGFQQQPQGQQQQQGGFQQQPQGQQQQPQGQQQQAPQQQQGGFQQQPQGQQQQPQGQQQGGFAPQNNGQQYDPNAQGQQQQPQGQQQSTAYLPQGQQ